jgi:hypothetical protein
MAGVVEPADETESIFMNRGFEGLRRVHSKAHRSGIHGGLAAAKRVFRRLEIGTPKP